MAKFAFDWGGSLETNSYLRQLTRDLIKAKHEVHIIAAAGVIPTIENYKQWSQFLDIPYTAFHRVFDVGQGPEKIALGKVIAMKDIGCHILYDDNEWNIKAVLAAGFEAVKISGDHPIPIPKELTSDNLKTSENWKHVGDG